VKEEPVYGGTRSKGRDEEAMGMKHLLRAAVAVIAGASMTASAVAAPCVAVAPKDLSGKIQVALPGGQSFAATYFQENGCDWAGNDDLNGFDGLVLDVAGLGGTAGNMVVSLGTSAFSVPVRGEFLDESCAIIADSEVFQASDGEAYSIAFPATAKWFIASPETPNPSSDVSIALHSDGKVCKKKKRK
jgi:hypothetical protein